MRDCPCMSACFYLCVCLSLRVYFCIHVSTSVDRHSLCIICPTISLFQWISLSLSLSLSRCLSVSASPLSMKTFHASVRPSLFPSLSRLCLCLPRSPSLSFHQSPSE